MRCRDDVWFWAALFVAANDADRDCSCDCETRAYDAYRPEPDAATLAARALAESRRRSRVRLAWSLGIPAALILAVIVARSGPNDSAPPFSPPTTEVAPPAAIAPAEAAEAAAPETHAAEVAATDVTPAPVDPLPLLAVNLLENIPPLHAVDAPSPAALPPAVFGVGNSREEVLIAQGSAPTYSAHHGRTLWWGSSRVEFDDRGNVRAWLNGTPPLKVEH